MNNEIFKFLLPLSHTPRYFQNKFYFYEWFRWIASQVPKTFEIIAFDCQVWKQKSRMKNVINWNRNLNRNLKHEKNLRHTQCIEQWTRQCLFNVHINYPSGTSWIFKCVWCVVCQLLWIMRKKHTESHEYSKDVCLGKNNNVIKMLCKCVNQFKLLQLKVDWSFLIILCI